MLTFLIDFLIVFTLAGILFGLSFLFATLYIRYKRREEKRYCYHTDIPPRVSRRDYDLSVTQPVRKEN